MSISNHISILSNNLKMNGYRYKLKNEFDKKMEEDITYLSYILIIKDLINYNSNIA